LNYVIKSCTLCLVDDPRDADEVAPQGTTDRLLNAAEELVAALGVEAASIRAVNALAGCNAAAVHYHFGSKEQVVERVLDRRMQMLSAKRFALMDALEDVAVPSAYQIAEVFLRPLIEIRRTESWGATYVRFIAALTNAGGVWQELLRQAFAPQAERISSIVARSFPDVPQAKREVQFLFASRSAIEALAHFDLYVALLADEADPEASAVAALLSFVALALDNPPSVHPDASWITSRHELVPVPAVLPT
jgi:AcrR family transcriptional regulator